MINTPRKVVETYAVPEFLQPVVQRLKRESRELTTLAAETNVVADRLLNTLDTKWLESSVVSIMAQATSASLSYRWVRWRTSSGQPWAQVHPASDIAQTWNLQASSIETQEIDSSDLHKLALGVTVETADGKAQQVSGKWQATVANLSGQDLSISIGSNATLQVGNSIRPEQLMEQSRIFFVQINGKVQEDAKLFDLGGRYIGRGPTAISFPFFTINRLPCCLPAHGSYHRWLCIRGLT